MDQIVSLPHADRFFEIRFESIGGLGAHAAGQVLATAAVLGMGLNGAHFSSYGSEKKGSLVRSFVRLGPAHRPIRTSAPVEEPDVIVVCHEALLRKPATLAGLNAGGTLICNDRAAGAPAAVLSRLPAGACVVRIDATRIAYEEKSRPNAVLLGTLTAQVPFLSADAVLESLSQEFAARHPEAVASNERAFRRGAREFETILGFGKEPGDLPAVRPEPLWGFETAPLGGVLPTPGNTVWNDLSASRTGFLPVFDEPKCIHCGLCDLVCPDLCLAWAAQGEGPVPTRTRLTGIDYRYCKGCLRCVESCPTGALSRQPEERGMAERLRVALFPELIP